jgi:hypothetical protein
MIPRPNVAVNVGQLFLPRALKHRSRNAGAFHERIAFLAAAAAAIAGGILYIASASEQTDETPRRFMESKFLQVTATGG